MDATTVLTQLVEASRISIWLRPSTVWELGEEQQCWPCEPSPNIRRRVRRAYAAQQGDRARVLRLAVQHGAVLTPFQSAELL